MESILLEIIITNQCNKRCSYCDLDFHDTFISDENIDILSKTILKESSTVEYFHMNFFGGEPLLGFSQIQKIVEKITIPNIRYSIGTNGNLFSREILNFFREHQFDVHLSIDTITGFLGISDIVKDYVDIIQVNFINDPDFLINTQRVYEEISMFGFKNVNFMPVFSTKKRTKDLIVKLGREYKKILEKKRGNIKCFNYFNGVGKEKQFILETDGVFYNDLDSLLWLQRQYSALEESIKKEIYQKTYNASLHDSDFSIGKLLKKYNAEDVFELVHEIPKSQGYAGDYQKIAKVLEYVK